MKIGIYSILSYENIFGSYVNDSIRFYHVDKNFSFDIDSIDETNDLTVFLLVDCKVINKEYMGYIIDFTVDNVQKFDFFYLMPYNDNLTLRKNVKKIETSNWSLDIQKTYGAHGYKAIAYSKRGLKCIKDHHRTMLRYNDMDKTLIECTRILDCVAYTTAQQLFVVVNPANRDDFKYSNMAMEYRDRNERETQLIVVVLASTIVFGTIYFIKESIS